MPKKSIISISKVNSTKIQLNAKTFVPANRMIDSNLADKFSTSVQTFIEYQGTCQEFNLHNFLIVIVMFSFVVVVVVMLTAIIAATVGVMIIRRRRCQSTKSFVVGLTKGCHGFLNFGLAPFRPCFSSLRQSSFATRFSSRFFRRYIATAAAVMTRILVIIMLAVGMVTADSRMPPIVAVLVVAHGMTHIIISISIGIVAVTVVVRIVFLGSKGVFEYFFIFQR